MFASCRNIFAKSIVHYLNGRQSATTEIDVVTNCPMVAIGGFAETGLLTNVN